MSGANRSDQGKNRKGGRDTIRHTFDWQEISPSMAVYRVLDEAIADRLEDINPIYYSIDLEAVDRLLLSDVTPDRAEVSFTHAGVSVVVHNDGEVVATPAST